MISGKNIYDVVAAIVPLYVAILLAYGSVKWWKIFTPDQCSGINRFVAVFAVPLLSFHFISANNPYSMNYLFLAADSLQKIVILFALFLWQTFSKNGSLEWTITLFSLSTLPNTLVMGIPLLKAMYGDFSGDLMVQIVVLQNIIWYNVILFLFEFRGAKLLVAEHFPETAASITSFKVESDVVSLNGHEPLQADAEIGDDGKLHVVVRRSASSSMVSSFNKSYGLNSLTSITSRASNLTGVDIYSVQSSREPTPRASSFNQTDFYAMFSSKVPSTNSFQGGLGDVYSLQSSKGATPRTSNFDEEMFRIGKKRRGRSVSGELFNGGLVSPYLPPTPMFSRSTSVAGGGGGVIPNKELHMFVWSSCASPVSDGNLRHAAAGSKGTHELSENVSPARLEIEEGLKIPTSGSPYTCQKKVDMEEGDGAAKKHQMPPASVMTRLVLIMVWRKLIRNPNTYSSILGLAWSLVSFGYHIQMPSIIKGSISILSDAGLGMAMFSLGLFMALQPKLISCGKSVTALSMAVRFLAGPAVIAATSVSVGIRGVLLQVSILQEHDVLSHIKAALPQGMVPFVFAKEYNVHANVLSTAVIFGMLVALPITILYYVLLGL